MAHLKKNTRGAVKGLSIHFERKTTNHSNQEIDTDRSHLNQDLMQDDSDMISRFNKRLENVYCMNRADVKALATWVVTLPEELKNEGQENQELFFEEVKNFLDFRYGKENAVCAVVHYDETTPHLHYGFIPVTYDDKKQREKVSAKEVLNRKDLRTFHTDLDKELKIKLPFYEKGILNDKTLEFENVEEIKKAKKELNKVQKNLEEKEKVLGNLESELPKELRKLNNKNKFLEDILKHDYQVDISKINKAEIKPRVILHNLENHVAPANKDVARDWQKTLEKAKEETDLPVSRLESAIETLKNLIKKLFVKNKEHELER